MLKLLEFLSLWHNGVARGWGARHRRREGDGGHLLLAWNKIGKIWNYSGTEFLVKIFFTDHNNPMSAKNWNILVKTVFSENNLYIWKYFCIKQSGRFFVPPNCQTVLLSYDYGARGLGPHVGPLFKLVSIGSNSCDNCTKIVPRYVNHRYLRQ